jgi:hypothetical protein
VIDFLVRLIRGRSVIGLADYMFNPDIPLFVRALSSFHGWLPFILIGIVWRLGYHRKAWIAQTLLTWVLLLVCYSFSPLPPAPRGNQNAVVNVNWVFGPGEKQVQTWMAPELYLALMMAFFPVCIYLPSHLLFRKVFRTPSTPGEGLDRLIDPA